MSRLLLSFLLLTVSSVPVHAGKPPDAVQSATISPRPITSSPLGLPPTDAKTSEAIRQERKQRQAMSAEVAQHAARQRSEVQALQVRFNAANSAQARLAIHKEISALKKAGRVDAMRIQLRHAQAAGRAAQVQELESAIEAMVNPPVHRMATPAVRTEGGR